MSSRRRAPKKKSNDKFVRIIVQAVVALSFVSLAYFFFHKLYPADNADWGPEDFGNKYEVRGIDLSHHNEKVNWNIVRERNISFAYLKVTEGSSLCDREYRQNYRRAKANNIHVGTYHFFSFRTPGNEQAKHFIEEAVCKKGDMVPAIDVEHSPGNKYSSKKEVRSKVVEELKVFEQKIRNHYGCYPLIYTNKECYELYIKDNFSKNPIWICDLKDEPDRKIDNWVIWQFSHKGKLTGTAGHIDLNYYRYSFDKFKKELLL